MPDAHAHARFLKLYLGLRPALWAYLRGLLGSAQDADDVCQEVSLVLWERFAEYDDRYPLLAWALGIARNHAARWRQAHRRDPAWLPADVEEKLARTAAELEEELAGRRRALELCIEKLGANARELLTLRYTRQLSLQQISRMRGMSLNAVNKALGKIRQFLSECTGHMERAGA